MAGQGAPIEVNGHLLQTMYEFGTIEKAADLHIELETSSSRPQGLRLKARGGQVVLNDQDLDDVVLWSDTAPPFVTANLQPSGSSQGMNLRVWNVWRDKVGTTQAWIGDAAIRAESGPDGAIVLVAVMDSSRRASTTSQSG
jgi:hypothetical protein